MRSLPRLLPSSAALLFSIASSLSVIAQTTSCPITDERKIDGAYRFSDGRLASILPSGADGQRRIIHFESGRSHRLVPVNAQSFESAGDWDSASPVAFRYRFDVGADGSARSLMIQGPDKRKRIAKRLNLSESSTIFKSGETELFGKLTLPQNGKPPFKTVIFVHGSDQVPSVDQEWLPHLFAANGIATFVFDKRGTGCSKGTYVQHFGVLSNDVLAAVTHLKARPEIDHGRIGLVGFSQGGWVAPLAALNQPTVKYVAIGYGLAMSMADEDRLETPLKMKSAGADEASIAEFQTVNAALHKTAREGFRDWREFESLVEKFQDRPWLLSTKSTQSWLGMTLQMGIPQAKQVAPQMFEHFFQPFYEPVPTLERLDIPMLWLLAGDDIEAPPEQTIVALKQLRQQGKRVTTVVFPRADHGLQEFEMKDGARVRTKYAANYFSTLLSWVQRQ